MFWSPLLEGLQPTFQADQTRQEFYGLRRCRPAELWALLRLPRPFSGPSLSHLSVRYSCNSTHLPRRQPPNLLRTASCMS